MQSWPLLWSSNPHPQMPPGLTLHVTATITMYFYHQSCLCALLIHQMVFLHMPGNVGKAPNIADVLLPSQGL